MTLLIRFGLLGLAMAAHALGTRKVWWTPCFGLIVQLSLIGYALTNLQAYWLVIPVSAWCAAWYITAIRKWWKER